MSELALKAALTLAAGALFAGLGAILVSAWSRRARALALGIVLAGYLAILILRPSYDYWINAAVLAVAIVGGAWIGRGLKSLGALAVFLVVVAVVDFVSFSGGLTHQIMQEYRETGGGLLPYLAVSVPVGGHIAPVAGVSDFLLAAAVSTAMREMEYSWVDALGAPLAGLLAALVVGLSVGGVYALPFLAVSVILWAFLRRSTSPSPAAC